MPDRGPGSSPSDPESAMRIAFVTPPAGEDVILVTDLLHGCWCQGRRVGGLRLPPLPQLMLATIARQAGHECRVIDVPNERMEAGRLREEVKGYDLCVLNVSSASFTTDRDFVRAVRGSGTAPRFAAYGSHATFYHGAFDRDLFEHVIAAPETPFGEIVGADKPGRFQSMDELPFVDYSLLPPKARYFNPIGKYFRFATLVTGRGCPGKCTFCTVPDFYGRKYRAMSGDRVAREVKSLKEQGFREIFFRDENFTTSRRRVVETCEAILRRSAKIDFIISSRVDEVDAELLGLLRRAGCRYIRYGVESGSDEMLKKVEKRTNREMITRTFRLTAEAGIKTHAHFIVGLPGEGSADVEATRDLIGRIRPDTLTVGVFTPLPGSRLYRELSGSVDLPPIESSLLHLKVYGRPDLTEEQRRALEGLPAKIYRSYYLRPSYIVRSLVGCRSIEELLIKAYGALYVLPFSLGR